MLVVTAALLKYVTHVITPVSLDLTTTTSNDNNEIELLTAQYD